MKIILKILLLVLLSFCLSLPSAYRAYALAQISLQNNTNLWLNLYIDNNFGCGPVMPSGFCTSSVTPGPHLLEARKGAEVVKYEDGVNIGDGTSPTWTVTIEDPAQALIKKLDGARYVGHVETSFIKSEEELVINGTTLISRSRVTWATPEIAQSMANGTNGFSRRPVGTWAENYRMQIIGREAHNHGSVVDAIYTISEDGNSINGIFKSATNSGTNTFYRQ
jgi:hypothetical protein